MKFQTLASITVCMIKNAKTMFYHVTQDMAQDFNSSEPETSSILSTSSHETLLTVELSSGLLWANESQLTGVRETGNLSSCICCSGRNMKEAVRL